MCSELRELNLSRNFLNDAEVCQLMRSLSGLKRLDISQNRLKNGPKLSQTVQSHLPKCKVLRLTSNHLLGEFRVSHGKLKELHLDTNKISRVHLTTPHLRILNLRQNKIELLEKVVAPHLEVLDCENNLLQTISFRPDQHNSIGEFAKLQFLNLASNKITSVLFSAKARLFTRCTSLNFSGNPL